MFKYHFTNIPLWSKAKYGGDLHQAMVWVPNQRLNTLKYFQLSRPAIHGMLLYPDMGVCSMVGRDADFSVCKGEYANNYSIVLVPGVFIRWDQPDPLTYIFQVRKGVLWPAVPPMNRSNREVTAEDIAWFLNTVKKESVLKDNFALTSTIEAVDRYTVKVAMLEPHADFLLNMAHTSMGLFPRECYEEKDCLNTKLISPSPFLMTESVPRGRVVFERNPEFHLKGLPYLDRMDAVNITDPQALKAAFITGQIDVIGVIFRPEEAEGIRQRVAGARIEAATVPNGNEVYRPQLKGPLADVRVRRAMTMTMDHLSMWEVALSGFSMFPTLISRQLFGSDFYMALEQAGEWYQFSPQRAKQLLAEAGYPEGFRVTITSSLTSGGWYDEMLHNQANWKKFLNIDVSLRVLDGAAANQAFYDASWDALLFQAGNNLTYWADGDSGILQFVTGSPNNAQKVNDPVVNELYRKQRGELGAGKRAALAWEFEQYELSQIYMLRISTLSLFQVQQPWLINCASQMVGFCGTPINTPSWLAMVDIEMRKGKK